MIEPKFRMGQPVKVHGDPAEYFVYSIHIWVNKSGTFIHYGLSTEKNGGCCRTAWEEDTRVIPAPIPERGDFLTSDSPPNAGVWITVVGSNATLHFVNGMQWFTLDEQTWDSFKPQQLDKVLQAMAKTVEKP